MTTASADYWIQRIYHDLAGTSMPAVSGLRFGYWLQQIYGALASTVQSGLDQRSDEFWSRAIYFALAGATGDEYERSITYWWQRIYALSAGTSYPDGSDGRSLEYWLEQVQLVGLAPAPPPPFAPSDLAGLALWLRADAGTFEDVALTVPAADDGDSVKGWQGQGATGRNATEAFNPPVLKLAIVNGRSVLRCDGAAQSLTVLDDATLDLTSGLTIFAVLKTIDAEGMILHHYESAGIFPGWAVAIGVSPGSTGKLQWYSDGGGWKESTGAAVNDGAAHILELVRTAGTLSMFIDGVAAGVFAANTTTAAAVDLAVNRLGLGGFFLAADDCEFLIYAQAHGAADRLLVRQYLAARWGVTL